MAHVPGFMEKCRGEIFNSFECLGGVNTLLFSQLCLYYCDEISKEHNLGVWSNYNQTSSDTPRKSAHLVKKVQPSFLRKDKLISQVIIGNRQQPICIPSYSALTVPVHINKLPPRTTWLVEQVEHHNSLFGIVVN